jgi:hypothetical protein
MGLLPLALTVWYWAHETLILPVVPIARWLIERILPVSIEHVRVVGATVEFAAGTHVIAVNPLIYGYGLPLFVAMMLASRPAGLAWKLPLGTLLLLVPQAWGVAFDVLLNFTTRIAPLMSPSIPAWKREAIAFGYQLGALILPAVVPVVLWLLGNRSFVYGVLFEGAVAEKALSDIPVRTPQR